MDAVFEYIVDLFDIKHYFHKPENIIQTTSYVGINSIDNYLNQLIFYLNSLNLATNLPIILNRLIDYAIILFMTATFIYILYFMKISMEKLVKMPDKTSKYDDKTSLSLNEILNEFEINSNDDNLNVNNNNSLNLETYRSNYADDIELNDNILFIRNRLSGKYEKYKLIKISKVDNQFDLIKYDEDVVNDDEHHASKVSAHAKLCTKTLQEASASASGEGDISMTSKVKKNDEQNKESIESVNDIIKINSLSMLSQVIINVTRSMTSNSTTLNDVQNVNMNNSNNLISSNDSLIVDRVNYENDFNRISEKLKKLNLKRLWLFSRVSNTSVKTCLFTCIANSITHVNNEEFWQRYERKSETKRPNLLNKDEFKHFLNKLRRIVYKYWCKNLSKFLDYVNEFASTTANSIKYENEQELKNEMKNYLNENFNSNDILTHTIPCILAVCLQLNIFIIRSENIIEITPDMLGKIELNTIPNIYLLQDLCGNYDAAVTDTNQI